MKQEEERKAKASAYMREYRRVKRQMEPEERCPRKAKHDPCWSREEANEGRQRLQQQARPVRALLALLCFALSLFSQAQPSG